MKESSHRFLIGLRLFILITRLFEAIFLPISSPFKLTAPRDYGLRRLMIRLKRLHFFYFWLKFFKDSFKLTLFFFYFRVSWTLTSVTVWKTISTHQSSWVGRMDTLTGPASTPGAYKDEGKCHTFNEFKLSSENI